MFKPGESGNAAGRPPGAKGKKSAIAFEELLSIFSDNMPRLRAEMAKLDGEAFVREMRGFAEYILPKQQRIVSTTFNTDNVDKVKEVFVIGGREFEL